MKKSYKVCILITILVVLAVLLGFLLWHFTKDEASLKSKQPQQEQGNSLVPIKNIDWN